MNKNPFGSALLATIKRNGINQSILARTLGVTPSYINQIVNGVRKPSPGLVELVSIMLRVPEEERRQMHYDAAISNGFRL